MTGVGETAPPPVIDAMNEAETKVILLDEVEADEDELSVCVGPSDTSTGCGGTFVGLESEPPGPGRGALDKLENALLDDDESDTVVDDDEASTQNCVRRDVPCDHHRSAEVTVDEQSSTHRKSGQAQRTLSRSIR